MSFQKNIRLQLWPIKILGCQKSSSFSIEQHFRALKCICSFMEIMRIFVFLHKNWMNLDWCHNLLEYEEDFNFLCLNYRTTCPINWDSTLHCSVQLHDIYSLHLNNLKSFLPRNFCKWFRTQLWFLVFYYMFYFACFGIVVHQWLGNKNIIWFRQESFCWILTFWLIKRSPSHKTAFVHKCWKVISNKTGTSRDQSQAFL